MYSRDPSTIQAPLGRRDLVSQAEHIFVSLDTYSDRRTAYTFGVTASGVRLDRYHPRDDEDFFDVGFDPVWEAQTSIDARGWTAELWIPFSQLRFNDQPGTDLGSERHAVCSDAGRGGLLGGRAANRDEHGLRASAIFAAFKVSGRADESSCFLSFVGSSTMNAARGARRSVR